MNTSTIAYSDFSDLADADERCCDGERCYACPDPECEGVICIFCMGECEVCLRTIDWTA